MRQRGWWLVAIVTGLLLMMASTHRLTAPPEPRAQNGHAQFDAGRAKARLARVLGEQAPHPADTAASDGVRDRLVEQLRAMGLQPRVDDRFACNGLFKQRGVACARVRNVLVTIGPAEGRHLLINSHYDSVPVGPGASDAGLGVATMLEVAGLLKDQRLARPVTFLFNEGEELGLVGARAFLDGDALAARIDSLINLEARGVRGPVNMFETSVPNAAAVRVFAEAVDRPVANSLAVSAYKQLPNYTDVNTFEGRGWLTLNLAPVGNETRYHSPTDDLEGVNLATLQHMGDQTLALASRLAAGPVPRAGGELLFMDVAGRQLVTLPMLAGVVLLGGLLLVFAVAAWKRRALLLGVPAMVVAVVLGIVLAWVGLTVLGGFRSGQFWRAQPQWTEMAIYAGMIAAGLLALAGARRLEVRQLRVAFWLLFVAVGVGVAFAAPGGIIYFLFPPLVVALGMLASRWWKPAETVAAVLAAVLLFVTLGGMLGLLEELVNQGPLWAFAPLGGLVLLPWLIEAKPLMEAFPRKHVTAAAALLATAAWVPAAAAPRYSADRQQQFTLQYVVDPAGRQPVWSIVNDRAPLPDSLTRFGRWEQGRLEALGQRLRWIAPAPVQAGFAPPRVPLVEQSAVPGGRRLRFRVQANGADSVMLVAPEDATVLAAGAPGGLQKIHAAESDGPYTLSCTGRSCEGALLELVVGPKPVTLTVLGTHWRLPPAAQPILAAKPANAQPQYLPDATILVGRVQV